MKTKKAIVWVVFWIMCALLFNIGVYIFLGAEKAMEFLGGYVIEETLSLDNLFLFIIIFQSFNVPPKYQRRILNYGIVGAIILRFIFVALGSAVVHRFSFILYIFGFILMYSGIKMIGEHEDKNKSFKSSKILWLLSKIIPITKNIDDDKFFIRKNKVLYATPLFAILILIEGSDILFAIDSIPAIFSITTDPFIVYTSNIFAIMGLRSLYFVLANLHENFVFMKHGVGMILTFTGMKLALLMINVHIPIVVSLMVIFSILIGSILLSLIYNKITINKNINIRERKINNIK